MKRTNDSDFSGMLGRQIGVRKVRGKVVVTNRPLRRLGKAVRGGSQVRFLEASQYAQRQLLDPAVSALYATGTSKRKKSPYMVAMTDYMVAPVVEHIDVTGYHGAPGDTILVRATDDFMVTKVKLWITDAQGVLVEEGEAAPDPVRVNQWGYKAKSANLSLAGTTIRAAAFDRPANRGELRMVL